MVVGILQEALRQTPAPVLATLNRNLQHPVALRNDQVVLRLVSAILYRDVITATGELSGGDCFSRNSDMPRGSSWLHPAIEYQQLPGIRAAKALAPCRTRSCLVRTLPCFPTRSTIHHRLSRCWMCFSVSAATSDRRSPQPSRIASIARSRSPFLVATSGAFRSLWACCTDSQFPVRTPIDFAPFTRVMPAASSGASSPLSAASTASFRTAVMRTLIETDPSPRASRATRQALTVALVKPARGSRPYQAKNSSSPRL